MQKEEKYLATAVWGTKKLTNIWTRGSALDFNILKGQFNQAGQNLSADFLQNKAIRMAHMVLL